MSRETIFRVYPEAVPRDVCDRMRREIRFCFDLQEAKIGGNVTSVVNKEIRCNRVAFLQPDSWINGVLQNYVCLANRDLWNFDVTDYQTCQYSLYEAGQFFHWHKDEFTEAYGAGEGRWIGLNRKITAVLTLASGQDEATGIRLKDGWGTDTYSRAANLTGSVLVFPAYTPHMAACAEGDTRESLTLWALGPPLR